MTEQTNAQPQMTEEQLQVATQFNQSVNDCIMECFKLNHGLMTQGHSATAVSLASALAAADLVSAIIVENNQSAESIDVMLDSLISDMRSRATEAFKFYVNKKALREIEAPAQQEAASNA